MTKIVCSSISVCLCCLSYMNFLFIICIVLLDLLGTLINLEPAQRMTWSKVIIGVTCICLGCAGDLIVGIPNGGLMLICPCDA